jgi:MSHA biogenesis protein MshL
MALCPGTRAIASACLLAAWVGVSAARAQPPQRPAEPARLPPLPVTQLDDRSQSADLDAARRFSLTLAEPVPVRDVLMLLVRGTPFSIALAPDLEGTFIGDLKDVTLRQALDAVLAPRGFAFAVEGTMIRVFPQQLETRFFDLNFLNVRRTWQRTLPTKGGVTLTSNGQDDMYDDVEKGLTALLSDRGRAHVDRRAGLAEVVDYASRLDRAALYVEALHVRASRQIRLQASILEVTPTNGSAIDWSVVRARLGGAPAGGGGGIAASAADVVNALAAQGDVRTIALPDVTTLNNEAAVLETATPNVSAMSLVVVPQIAADGVIQLSVAPSISERAGGRPDASGAAAMRVSQADTVGRVPDGSTLVVAGLLTTAETTQPAPGIRGFFGATDHRSSTRELVVLVTPTIVGVGPARTDERQRTP